MRSALDQVPDQEHGNQSDCEYAAKYYHMKNLAEGGMCYNCLRPSRFGHHPDRHFCQYMRCLRAIKIKVHFVCACSGKAWRCVGLTLNQHPFHIPFGALNWTRLLHRPSALEQ